jgi:hypothetical protein
MEKLLLGSEWFYCQPVPLDDVERILPKLSSGERDEYLVGWLLLMLKATVFADHARELDGDEKALHLARLCSLMPDDDIEGSVHTALRVSYDFAKMPVQ